MNTISHRMLRLPEVRDITGVSRSSIYKWMDEGKFPLPRKLSERAKAWDSREIAKWVDSRPVHEEYQNVDPLCPEPGKSLEEAFQRS